MVSQKSNEHGMIETSDTDLVSGTESFSSDHSNNKQVINPSLSLENLFSELSQETKKSKPDVADNDKFKKLQKSISSLPRLESALEEKIDKEATTTKNSNDITRINDPILHKPRNKSKDEETDAGDRWFNMKQPELTPELKRDLLVIKQRNALDPKRHYKKEKWNIPKYFQMGTIIEGNTEFHSARLNRRDRGKTLVEEVLNDNDKRKYFKRKYSEIQTLKTSGGKNHYKNIKSMRKKY